MNFKYKLMTAGFCLAAVCSYTNAEAEIRHISDSQQHTVSSVMPHHAGETKAVQRGAEKKGSLDERIHAILHPPVEEKPVVNFSGDIDSILGQPRATQEQCVKYLLSVNPAPNISVSPSTLVSYYYEEGEREGVRPDVAFAQALKETGFFRYGGTVTPDQNNYCGLGTTSATVKGAYFSSSLLGVRAHIQHLLAYASTKRPQMPIVDPRYELVRQTYGNATLNDWQDLNGRWAVPGYTYGESIIKMFDNILQE